MAAGGDERVRRPVARVVRALASTGLLPADAQEYWVQTLLQWASTGAGDPTSPQHPLASEEDKRNRARINRAVIAALQSRHRSVVGLFLSKVCGSHILKNICDHSIMIAPRNRLVIVISFYLQV